MIAPDMCFIADQREAAIAAVHGPRMRWIVALLVVGACGSSPPPVAEPPVVLVRPVGEGEVRAATEPEVSPAPAEVKVETGRSPCRPERPDSAYERSLCLCEEQCTRRIDRAALADRLARHGADAETVRRMTAGEPGALHYPYHEVDGLRLEFDGEGRVTRCSHSVLSDPSATVALECAAR